MRRKVNISSYLQLVIVENKGSRLPLFGEQRLAILNDKRLSSTV